MRRIPTLESLQQALENDLKRNLNITDYELKKTLSAMSASISAQLKLLYLYLGDIQNNVFPDTADLEANGGTLERLGRIYINRNPRPSTGGVFVVRLSGIDGSVLRSAITFKSNEDSKNPNQLFISDNEYILNGVDDFVEIRSLGSGLDFDLSIGDRLTITEPIAGIDKTVVVSEIIENPRTEESIEVYRQNIIDAIQLEPQGGSKTDYILWSSDAQGVRKVYPYVSNNNAGTVNVFVEATIENSIDGKGTPTQALLDEVLEVIEFDPDETKPTYERGRRPIQANVVTLPITLVPVDITIQGLNNSSTAVRDSLSQNLDNFIRSVRPYIAGADLPRDRNNVLNQGRLQAVATDVLDNSNFFQDFILSVQGVQVSSYEFTQGNIPFLNNITYV